MPEAAMKDPKNYFTAEQVNTAIDAIPNLRDKLLVKLHWIMGARVSEVLSIRVSMIDFDDEMIGIKSLKKKRDEWCNIPVDRETLEMIKQYLTKRGFDSDYLFTADGDKPLTRQMAYFIIRDAFERVGITRVGDPRITKRGLHPHPHTLRHSFAIDWFKRGGRPELLQRILRHEHYETTMSYLRFSDADLKEAFDKIKAGR